MEYSDGGRGDTLIEIDLRHPGTHNRNVVRVTYLFITILHIKTQCSLKTKKNRGLSLRNKHFKYFSVAIYLIDACVIGILLSLNTIINL